MKELKTEILISYDMISYHMLYYDIQQNTDEITIYSTKCLTN